MTTHFRTHLLLGFTALVASLSGCILETSSGGGGGNSCAENRFFEVYWSVDDAAGTFICTDPPADRSHVELDTSTGTYSVGVECRATRYMGFIFDFAGSTVSGIPTGTYVTTANLVLDGSTTVISHAPGAGAAFAMPACDSVTVAYPFGI